MGFYNPWIKWGASPHLIKIFRTGYIFGTGSFNEEKIC